MVLATVGANLESLDLRRTQTTSLPRRMGELHYLSELDLSGCRFQDISKFYTEDMITALFDWIYEHGAKKICALKDA